MTFDTPQSIEAFKLLTLWSALKLETVGLRASRGFSAFAYTRKLTGLKARTAAEMIPKFEQWLKSEKGIDVTK